MNRLSSEQPLERMKQEIITSSGNFQLLTNNELKNIQVKY